MADTVGEQRVRTFMAALMAEGVTPFQIESAVSAARKARVGTSIGKLANIDPRSAALVNAFVNQETERLEKK